MKHSVLFKVEFGNTTECPAHHETLNLEHGIRLASYELRPSQVPKLLDVNVSNISKRWK